MGTFIQHSGRQRTRAKIPHGQGIRTLDLPRAKQMYKQYRFCAISVLTKIIVFNSTPVQMPEPGIRKRGRHSTVVGERGGVRRGVDKQRLVPRRVVQPRRRGRRVLIFILNLLQMHQRRLVCPFYDRFIHAFWGDFRHSPLL